MSRPVVIVDPLSSGVELAPTFRARGVPAVAVTLKTEEWPEFGAKMQASDFLAIIADQPDIVELVSKYDPLAIIPGTEEAIPLAERLTAALLPKLSNDPSLAMHRAHKALMQTALEAAGVPALRTLDTRSESEAEAWIRAMRKTPLIIKPPMSSGSEMVFHIAPGGDWKKPFSHVLTQASVLTGKPSETVVLQEQAIGQEFAVGTVSVDGRHFLAHLIKYNKTSVADRQTVYDFVEFVPLDDELREVFDYTKRVLEALGVRWGAAHTEIMLTKNGPRLIETSARMIGGPVVGFARAATGSSQADKLVEIYVDGDVRQRDFIFKRTVVPVFLRAASQGRIGNLQALDMAKGLPTLLSKHVWVRDGDLVPQTVDYLTSIGIIALTGDRDSIFRDYQKVRAMESELVFAP